MQQQPIVSTDVLVKNALSSSAFDSALIDRLLRVLSHILVHIGESNWAHSWP